MNKTELRNKLVFDVLDDGFVKYVDHMGSDKFVVETARLTSNTQGRSPEQDRKLLRYLMRHRHTSPFEFCELVIHVRCPIFVFRQWVRHRTFSFNEYSGRYSKMINSANRAENWRLQSKNNRQGSSGIITDEAIVSDLNNMEKETQTIARRNYEKALEYGVAREQARKELPLSTYTEVYCKVDLHNLLHFLSLRMSEHAQYEIRMYAYAVASIVRELFPWTWEAFVDYRLESTFLTRLDRMMLNQLVSNVKLPCTEDDFYRLLIDEWMDTGGVVRKNRERDECLQKFKMLGLVV